MNFKKIIRGIIFAIRLLLLTPSDIGTEKEEAFIFQHYYQLKSEEQWQKIIDISLYSMDCNILTEEEFAIINLRIASCFYYLGNFKETSVRAKKALDLLLGGEQYDLLARSYYLISASYRAMALNSINIEKKINQEFVRTAHEFINKALVLIQEKGNEVKLFTKSKVYFNAGALFHDVDKNTKQAMSFYAKSTKFLNKDKDDYHRIEIRRIRCLLEENLIKDAFEESLKLSKYIDFNTKTGVHFLQLQAKIALAAKKYKQALYYAEKAIIIAKQKNMKLDLQRLEDLKRKIFEVFQ
jgi:hypothetical protein